MMKRNKLILTVLLAVSVGLATGCSSSKKSETGEALPGEELPTADAGTDAVPNAESEVPAPPSDVPPPPGDVPPAMAEAVPPPPSDVPPPASEPAIPPPPVAPPMASTEPPASAGIGSGENINYTVQTGDTLMKIAFENYGDLYRWKDIYEANKSVLPDPNSIPTGTVLKIEKPSVAVSIERNGEKYLIKLGDTLAKISGEVYGTESKWKKLWENNKQMIKDPNKIYAGFYLYYIPEAESSQPQMAEAPAAPAVDTNAAAAPAPTPEAAMPPAGEVNREPAAGDLPPPPAE